MTDMTENEREPLVMKHDISHAITGCGCSISKIKTCVICGKLLASQRVMVDTCGKVCFRRLLAAQRSQRG
jgi:hypothetical protein